MFSMWFRVNLDWGGVVCQHKEYRGEHASGENYFQPEKCKNLSDIKGQWFAKINQWILSEKAGVNRKSRQWQTT